MKSKEIHKTQTLFPKVRQRVLELLYGKPDQLFYTNEIIRLSDSGTGAVQRELTKLTNMNLIKFELFGNQKRYQADQSSPIYIDLRNIILKTFGLSDVMCEVLTPIATQIQFAFIYGSIASGKDKTNSDIDLMIISDTLSYAELFSLLSKPEKKLGRKINPTFYSEIEWIEKRKQKNNFAIQIIKRPKIFLIGNENEFIKFK